MKCTACGRQLKSLKSREIGYGPVCYRKMFGDSPGIHSKAMKPPVDDIPYYDIPGQMTIDEFLDNEA